jgi:N-acetylmuramoyl-L-alanine amidase
MIVIDPGHGGSDPGAVGGHIFEKDLALTYSLTLAGELALVGVPVMLTRKRDELPGGGSREAALLERARIANAAGAQGFVSIHFNASALASAQGLWLIHAAGAAGGRSLATALQKELGGKIYHDDSPFTGGRRLAVLRHTAMPAVLVEVGFISNPEEREELEKVWRLRKFVAAAGRGITDWLGGTS